MSAKRGGPDGAGLNGDAAATAQAELRKALGSGRGLLITVGLISVVVNMLMLTGPIFMLQVYDRVLASGSMPTLAVLFGLVCGLFLIMGVLDYLRARILARVGARFQSLLDRRVFFAQLYSRQHGAHDAPTTGLRDLESIQKLLTGPAPFAFFDAPWTPLYLLLIFAFHPWLGWLAIAGGAVLLCLALLNERASKRPAAEAAEAQHRAELFEQGARREAEALWGLGMALNTLRRWRVRRDEALAAQMAASDKSGAYSTSSKTMRMFLQSAMLALGASLVILQEITPGVMIAASILLGRALSPIEQAIGQWTALQRAVRGWKSLKKLLAAVPQAPPRMALPRPKGQVSARMLTAGAPGERTPIIKNLNFTIEPGTALGVIGPSGSGKSSLARVLIGYWGPLGGEVTLDGATLDQWEPDALGGLIGYLPQDVALLEGSVAENICRMAPETDEQAVVAAAQQAGAHEMILGLPDGYNTQIGFGGAKLSGGQRQRVALARALYGDPALVVLDEPNSSLDFDGETALNKALVSLKERGRTAIVIAHRPSVINACDMLLMVDKGMQRAFGPKDEVLSMATKQPEGGAASGPQLGPQPGTQTAAGVSLQQGSSQTPNGDQPRRGLRRDRIGSA